MNRLKQNLCYLIGPIDEAADKGVGWREDLTEFLQNIGVGVFNPCDKPTDFAEEDANFVETLRELKKHGKYAEVAAKVKPVVSIDLHMLDLSNFCVMYVDKNVHMCGSYAEATYASLEHKPIIVVGEQGVSEIPSWLFGMLNHELFFDDWYSAKRYIKHVAFDEFFNHPSHGWRFFDYNHIFKQPVENLNPENVESYMKELELEYVTLANQLFKEI